MGRGGVANLISKGRGDCRGRYWGGREAFQEERWGKGKKLEKSLKRRFTKRGDLLKGGGDKTQKLLRGEHAKTPRRFDQNKTK